MEQVEREIHSIAPLPIEKQIDFALQGTMIADLIKTGSIDTLKFFIKTAVARAEFQSGWTIEEDSLGLLLQGVENELISKGSGLRPQEIMILLDEGIRGRYGELYGLSIRNISLMIKGYISDSMRLEALERARKKKEAEDPTVIQQKNYEAGRSRSLELFDLFKKEGYCEDMGNVSYDFLKAKGLIFFEESERKDIWSRALFNVKSKLSVPSNDISISRANKKLLELLESNNQQPSVIVEAKKICINEYFRRLIETKTELSDLLSDSL